MKRHQLAFGFTKQTIFAPGSRGGKFYRNDAGDVRYGARSFASGSSSPAEFEGFRRAGVPIGVVAGLLSRPMQAEVVKHVSSGGHVFVDSGAFGVAKAAAKQGGGGKVDFSKVFGIYDTLVAGLTANHENLLLVMPDVIGKQAETHDLQRAYAKKIRGYIDAGVRVLVPVQLGELSPAEALEVSRRIIGRSDFATAIPANLSAFTAADLSNLAGAHPGRLHLLGIGGREKALNKLVGAIHAIAPETEITTDSNRLKGWVGYTDAAKTRPRLVTGHVKARLDEAMPEAARGIGRFGHLDETEFIADIAEHLTQKDYGEISAALALDGWKDAKQRVADGSIDDYGDWWYQLQREIWARHSTTAIQPRLRSDVIAEVAGAAMEGQRA